MDSTLWQRLRPLFDRAIELEADERAHFLDEIRDSDAEIHRELLRLLRWEPRLREEPSRNAMELIAPAVARLLAAEADLDGKRIGECVGPYLLIQLLGSGGMGAVYLAERSDQAFEQIVALKIVRAGFVTPSARERFERERRVLSGLHHPGIAQLFDGGKTDDGQDFYTMEFVAGKPLTEYCRTLDSVAAQLRVLLQVASALAYAHQNLIVHRDIKPANVLVDEWGRAKIVDFGLAKSLGGDADAMLTAAGVGPMTPAFAAPEQFHNETVTVATDVYQFGVLCFNVLTGKLPYRADPNDPFEWAKAVSTEEPMLLAHARDLVDASGDETPLRPPSRGLTRDLDAIVRKALSKSPAARYRSMDALAADLQACLEGRPVSAQRATPIYFASRFIWRWRYAVAATVLAFVALAATAFLALRQSKLATLQAEHATAVAGFLVSLFQVSDPGVNRGERLNANQILDEGRRRLEHELADQPLERARLSSVIGEVYMELGDFSRARAPLESAVSLMHSSGAEPLELAHALNTLAAVALHQNDASGASALLDQAESLIPDVGHAALEERAMLHARRALQLHASSQLTLAKDEFKRALELSEAAGNARSMMTARIHNNFGTVLKDLDDKEGARREYEAARLISVESGNEFLSLVPSMNLATVLIDLGDLDQARDLLRKTQDRLRQFFGDNVDVANAEFFLGDIARKKGDLDEALTRLASAQAMLRATVGDRHPFMLWARSSYAQALIARGELGAGLDELERVLELGREIFDPLALDLAESLDRTVVPLLRAGRTQDALDHAEEALAIWRLTLPAQHRKLVRSLLQTGLARFALGDTQGAKAALDEALLRSPYPFVAEDESIPSLTVAIIDPTRAMLDLQGNIARRAQATIGAAPN